MINDGSATLNGITADGITADGIVEGIKQQKQAHRDAVLTMMRQRQQSLKHSLHEAQRQIEAMLADIEADALPRYAGHLAATVREIVETSTTITAFNNAL